LGAGFFVAAALSIFILSAFRLAYHRRQELGAPVLEPPRQALELEGARRTDKHSHSSVSRDAA
jgi:hypothetical protein